MALLRCGRTFGTYAAEALTTDLCGTLKAYGIVIAVHHHCIKYKRALKRDTSLSYRRLVGMCVWAAGQSR